MLFHEWRTPRIPSRVVILGSGGFVGSSILSNLQRRHIPVVGLKRSDIDLLKPGAASELAKILSPDDAVVASAAIAPVKNLAMLQENISIIEVIAESLRKRPVAHLINISSDAIYSDSDSLLNETSPTAPSSLHGIMHLTREIVLREAVKETPFVTIRPTLIYGKNDPHNGYGPNRFMRLAINGKEIVLFGQGEERRDHVLIDDVADLSSRILMHRSSGVLNIACGTVVSFRDIAEQISAAALKRVEVKFSPRIGAVPHNGYRAFDPAATHVSFPDFQYTQPREGFRRVFEEMNGLL